MVATGTVMAVWSAAAQPSWADPGASGAGTTATSGDAWGDLTQAPPPAAASSADQAALPHATGAAISGAGSTFSLNAIQQWAADVKKQQGLTVSYQGVGSGAGQSQFIAGTVDFAGSDVPFNSSQAAQATTSRGGFVYVPVDIGGIALEYNLPGSSSVRLSPSTIAKIFTGKITSWDDPAIVADNGSAPSSSPIVPVVRSDSSGTSSVFSAYLSTVDPKDWTTGASKSFPVPGDGVAQSGSGGITAYVQQTPGAIGYAEASYPQQSGLPTAKVKNASGQFRGPDDTSVSDALANATIKSDGTLDLTGTYNSPSPLSYPISTVSYVITPTKISSAKGQTLVAFLKYAVGAGQSRISPLGYAPMPSTLVQTANAQIAKINPPAVTPTSAPAPVVPVGRVGGSSAASTAVARTIAAPATSTSATSSAATDAPAPSLPRTGAPIGSMGLWGLGLVAAGGILAVSARRRRPLDA